MGSILKLIEIILAILGVYFIVLRIAASIIYSRIVKASSNKEIAKKPSPKYTIVESCPICGEDLIDIFENYDIDKNGEQVLVGYSIGCLHCGLRSPVLISMEQCIEYWNIRNCKKTQSWVAGEPEFLDKEIKNEQTQRQSTSDEQADNKSVTDEIDNI